MAPSPEIDDASTVSRSPDGTVPEIGSYERVSGELFGTPSGSRASAGRIIGVGLLCFAIWLLLDANQLYHSAVEGPLGTRRTVAVALLRPVAAVSNALHLSGLVNWGDSALNRSGSGTVGQNQNSLPPPPVVTGPHVDPIHTLSNGETPLPHRGGNYVPPPVVPSFPVSLIAAPTAAHPITILDIGDSVGEDLGLGLGDVFTGDRYVTVLQKGVEDTGLDRPDYWNWPGHLEQYLQRYHPQAVVIMMGANDDQNLNEKGNSSRAFCNNFGPPCVVPINTRQWVSDYTARINLLMEESLLAGAHVFWVGLPPMGGGNVTSAFCQKINSIAQAQAKRLPDVTYYSSWPLLSGPHGRYAEYLRVHGTEEQIRSSDGIHLDPAGYDLLANAIVEPMEQAWHVDLHVAR